LEEYEFTIHYRSGKIISYAYFLSRIQKAKSAVGEEKDEKSVVQRQTVMKNKRHSLPENVKTNAN
jgi:hypothetical protein